MALLLAEPQPQHLQTVSTATGTFASLHATFTPTEAPPHEVIEEAELGAESIPPSPTVRKPWDCIGVTLSLVWHTLTFLSQICAVVIFAKHGDSEWWFFGCTLLAILISGAFCCLAAWRHASPACRLLPLKQQPFFVALPMLLLLGLGQGIVFIVALEGDTTVRSKYHLKAIFGLFEGLVFSVVITYAWATGHFKSDWGEEQVLIAVASISFLSGGLALLELDRCTSTTVSARLRSSCMGLVHWIFRTAEVTSRVSMYVFFVHLVTDWWHEDYSPQRSSWSWNNFFFVPPLVDYIFTFCSIYLLGGAEQSHMEYVVISFIAVLSNVFEFVDSPYKRRAARCVTAWLRVRNFVTPLVLGLVLLLQKPLEQRILHTQIVLSWTLVVSTCLYWAIEVCQIISTKDCWGGSDLYTASANGSEDEIRAAIFGSGSSPMRLDVNGADVYGQTALVLAAACGSKGGCALLLKEGARVTARISPGCRRIASLLNRAARNQWTALHIASYKGDWELVEVLLGTAAHLLQEDWALAVQEEMRRPTNIQSFQDTQGDTPLHLAASGGDLDTVRALMVACPHWHDVANTIGFKPRDLVPSTDPSLRQELLFELSPRKVAVAAGTTSQVVAPSFSMRSTRPELWVQRRLPICHLCPESQLIADGLCSYILGSCGGPTGRIFARASPTQLMTRSEEQQPPPSFDSPEQALHDLWPVNRQGVPLAAPRPGWWYWMRRGRFPEEAKIGGGGTGKVYRLRQRTSQDCVAVKVLEPSMTTAAEREALMANLLCLSPHPNLATIFQMFRYRNEEEGEDQEPFDTYMLLMEYCEGGSLDVAIYRAMRTSPDGVYRPPAAAFQWVRQMFLGLEHLHEEMNVLHRDMKPANVLLTRDGRAKLTDFGYSRYGVRSAGRWSMGEYPPGSPGYVAPEVLRRWEHSKSADFYSFGVTVWVLLTCGDDNKGKPPSGFSLEMPSPPRRRCCGQWQWAHPLYSMMYEDFRLLQNAVNNTRHLLDRDAYNFILNLVHHDPRRRLDHRGIRRHEFIRRFEPPLPSSDAGAAAVEEWNNALSILGPR